MRKLDEKTIILCGRKRCCPTIAFDDETNKFKIKDDFNGSVELSKDEFLMLEEALDHYKKVLKGNE